MRKLEAEGADECPEVLVRVSVSTKHPLNSIALPLLQYYKPHIRQKQKRRHNVGNCW